MNQPHSTAHLTHLGNAQMHKTKLLIGCAHLLCLELSVQDVTFTLLTAYSSCRHSTLTQSVLDWVYQQQQQQQPQS